MMRTADRVARVVEYANNDPQHWHSLHTVIPCVNVDNSRLPSEVREIVSVTHKLTRCQVCGEDMWIGERQSQAQGVRLCYMCLITMVAVGVLDARILNQIVTLNPHANNVPRRFAT